MALTLAAPGQLAPLTRRGIGLLAWTALSSASSPVAAHAGDTSATVSQVLVVTLLALGAVTYVVGHVRLAQKGSPAAGSGSAFLFGAGWSSLALVLSPPVDRSAGELFWMHMVQHEVLMLVSAPLLVLSRPQLRLAWGLPPRLLAALAPVARPRWVRRLVAWQARPLPAWTLHALAVWLWHTPLLFEAAVASEFVHALQHFTFFGSALILWRSLVGPQASRVAFLSMFTTLLHTGFLGMLLAFSTAPWYASYAATVAIWSLTPLEDQQIGGLVMWIPAGAIMLGTSLALVWHLIDPSGSATSPAHGRARLG